MLCNRGNEKQFCRLLFLQNQQKIPQQPASSAPAVEEQIRYKTWQFKQKQGLSGFSFTCVFNGIVVAFVAMSPSFAMQEEEGSKEKFALQALGCNNALKCTLAMNLKQACIHRHGAEQVE